MDLKEMLKQDLVTRRLSRRDFVAGMTTLGVGAVAAATLADGLIAPARADTPKKGGTLRFATNDASSADTLDPHKALSFTDITNNAIVYEKLTEFDADGKLVPWLAESFAANPAASVWTFQLRKGVTFHNGKTMSAADVVYSFQRILDKKTGSPGASTIAEVSAIKADGANTVVFELKGPNAEFPYFLTSRTLCIVPEGADDFAKQPVGTGPWKVKSFQAGIAFSFVRNDSYWMNGLPYIAELEGIGIGDETARLNALLSGEADLIQTVNPKAVKRLDASGVAHASIKSGTAHATYPMNAKQAPFDNNDVRTALKHSFDRQRLIDLAFDGQGTIGRDAGVWPTDPMFCDAVAVPQADPDKVKALLKKAGHESTVFELHTSDGNYGGANAAVVLAELMKENGVNVKVIKDPADGYWSAVYMKVGWCGSSWTSRPTAIALFETGYTSTAPYNESFFANAAFDKLVADAKKELDEGKRKELLCEAQKLIAAESGQIAPVYVPWIDGVANRVKDFKSHPRQSIGSSLWQQVWLES
ncbi:MAG: ABC transporter substrate-binding protein [Dongiaceae bacterium]